MHYTSMGGYGDVIGAMGGEGYMMTVWRGGL